MKKVLLVLLLLAIGSCGVLSVSVARLGEVKHLDVKLSEDAATCRVVKPETVHAWHGDFVHWAVKGEGSECKNKLIEIAHGPNDFKTCDENPQPKASPFVKCSDPQNTGDLTKETHLYCRVDAFASYGCYKYSFGGQVKLDPEIEIERPRNPLLGLILRFLSLFV
jgi:hypothetical protein